MRHPVQKMKGRLIEELLSLVVRAFNNPSGQRQASFADTHYTNRHEVSYVSAALLSCHSEQSEESLNLLFGPRAFVEQNQRCFQASHKATAWQALCST
jgi:hypothetical protein